MFKIADIYKDKIAYVEKNVKIMDVAKSTRSKFDNGNLWVLKILPS